MTRTADMKLFLVRHEIGAFNTDLFCVAETVEQAIDLWREWEYVDAEDEPFWVREITFAKVEGPARYIHWEAPDLPVVFDNPDSY